MNTVNTWPDNDAQLFKKGSGIRIKEYNRGKFTESAKRAGMSVQQFAAHVLANKDKYNTTTIRRANFARNAGKFKHQDGGQLLTRFMQLGGKTDPVFVRNNGQAYWVDEHGNKVNPSERQIWQDGHGYDIYSTDGNIYSFDDNDNLVQVLKGARGKFIGSNARTPRGQQLEYRPKYYNLDSEFRDSVNVIAQRYGISPSLLASRLGEEGIIDKFVNEYNNTGGQGLNQVKQRAAVNGRTPHDDEIGIPESYINGFNNYGLNYSGSDLLNGYIHVKEPWVRSRLRYGNGQKGTFEKLDDGSYKIDNFWNVDELKNVTWPVAFPKWSDGLSVMAAELKARKDEIKKRYPIMSEEDLDAATSAAYNMGTQKFLNLYKDNKNILNKYRPYIK